MPDNQVYVTQAKTASLYRAAEAFSHPELRNSCLKPSLLFFSGAGHLPEHTGVSQHPLCIDFKPALRVPTGGESQPKAKRAPYYV
jgi:hypothetical protein